MKRRQFSQFFALLAGSLALPALAWNRSALARSHTDSDMEQLSRSFFEARVGKTFHVAGEEARTMVLKRTENACGEHCREQFHLTFEVNPGKRLNEGVFRLKNRYSDSFDLFLTESAHGDGRQRLIATINRQIPV